MGTRNRDASGRIYSLLFHLLRSTAAAETSLLVSGGWGGGGGAFEALAEGVGHLVDGLAHQIDGLADDLLVGGAAGGVEVGDGAVELLEGLGQVGAVVVAAAAEARQRVAGGAQAGVDGGLGGEAAADGGELGAGAFDDAELLALHAGRAGAVEDREDLGQVGEGL